MRPGGAGVRLDAVTAQGAKREIERETFVGHDMHVIATAGHVDHGKSTLVRALTGMEPDRWAEERRRGMTIDLGYAWARLPQGPTVAFVDVPGHERFIGNMLAGLGPAPAVLMVVAADEGWRAQSAEHLAASNALGLRHGLLAVTRSDLADPAATTVDALRRIDATSLGRVRAVQVSGRTGLGIDSLREALADLVGELPMPRVDGRVRLWVDRSFTIRGSGTVVTGTLTAGGLSVGDQLSLGKRLLRIRGLHSLGKSRDRVQAVSRVAINLRGAAPGDFHRGAALVSPDAWTSTALVDARTDQDAEFLPGSALLHLGTGAFPVRIRPLARRIVRLSLPAHLPLEPGDRGILRNPGQAMLEGGIEILDVAPPPLRRRGAAAQRGTELAAARSLPRLIDHVERRGAVRADELGRLGVGVERPVDVRKVGDWLISHRKWQEWSAKLGAELDRNDRAHPMEPGLPLQAARRLLDIPDQTLLDRVATEAGLQVVNGRLQRPGSRPSLGTAEGSVVELEKLLRRSTFSAPERPDLERLRLGRRELAAAERAGRLLRLADDVVLLPDAPLRAVELLERLPQPFTTSQARAVLSTTRRVAIPLLEHLDRSGVTRQLQPGSRVLVARPSAP